MLEIMEETNKDCTADSSPSPCLIYDCNFPWQLTKNGSFVIGAPIWNFTIQEIMKLEVIFTQQLWRILAASV